jgi:iron complex outermembrane receptor protein
MFQRTKLCTSLLVAFSGGLFAVAPTFAQDAGGNVQRVEITGSSIKRIDAETDAPVQTLTREDIARTGAATVEELLRSISAATSSGATVAASASGATTGGISTVSLRGLGAERTLILVNGQRTAPYGSPSSSIAVDVDSIPVAAIERIEVLKEGAGAVYGSDAIAGVINFILRKNFNGGELSLNAGTSYDHKGSETRVSLLAGKEFEHGNATFLITAEHLAPLYGKDRPFARTAIREDKDNFAGSSRTDPGNINIPGVGGTYNPAVPSDGSGVGANCGPNSTYNAAFGPTNCLFDTAPFVSLYPDSHKVGMMFTGHYDVSDAFHLKADLSMSNKSQETSIQPAPIDSAFGIPFSLTTASPYYPTAFVQALTEGATPTLRVRYRPFITGNRDLTDNATNFRAVVGAEGTLAGWDYDANLLYATSQVKENLNSGFFRICGNNSAGTAAIRGVVDVCPGAVGTGPGIEALLNGAVKDASGNTLWVNPFGQNSAAVVAAARATNFVGTAFTTNTSITSGQLKASKEDLFKLPAGNVGAAMGLEYRQDGFKLNSAEALASGDISGYGGSFFPIDKSRAVIGAFAELDVPIFKGFDIDVAARYDRYATTTNPNTVQAAKDVLTGFTDANGDPITWNPATLDALTATAAADAPSFGHATAKAGAKWKIAKSVLVRGTWATGFRAPSLLDLFGPVQPGVSAVLNDPARCPTTQSTDDCGTQFNVFSGGNAALKPERSTTWTVGTVLEPMKNVSLTVDYNHTKLKDSLAVLGVDYMLANESRYTDHIFRGPASGGLPGPILAIDQRTENLSAEIVAGLDFDLKTAFDTGMGRFGFETGGTWQTKWETVNVDGTTSSAIGQTSSTSPGVIPRMRVNATASYRTPGGQFQGSVTYNWQSGFTDICGNLDQNDNGGCADGFTAPKVRPYTTTDMQLGWNPTKAFSGTFGVRNIFGNQPPYVNASGGAFQASYDPTYVDPHGRFFYVAGTVRF